MPGADVLAPAHRRRATRPRGAALGRRRSDHHRACSAAPPRPTSSWSGMAVQAGCLPISPARIEEAIGLNGVAVEANTDRLPVGSRPDRRPRRRAGPPARPDQPVTADPPVPARSGWRHGSAGSTPAERQPARSSCSPPSCAASRTTKLAGRGSTCSSAPPGPSVASRRSAPRLLAAVAANLYKLMAYKDEYEVARLMTDADGMAEARRLAGPSGRIAWKLHPPMLRALGMSEKISVGSWGEPAIRALARAKRLRGTVADPFRWTEVRRVERSSAGRVHRRHRPGAAPTRRRQPRRCGDPGRAARPGPRLRGDQARPRA